MQSARTAIAKRLRHDGKEKIFGDLANDMNNDEHFAVFIGRIDAGGSTAVRYSATRAPILHTRRSTEQVYKLQDAFTRPLLKTVSKLSS